MEAPRIRLALDSSAVIALLRDEPAAGQVEELLHESPARMSIVNAAEVVDVLVRRYARSLDEVVAALEQLVAARVEAVAPSLEQAAAAGELRARVYNRRTGRVSLADCFVLATASAGETIVTTDTVLADVARAEGLPVVVLGA